jgi:hypothetical protein
MRNPKLIVYPKGSLGTILHGTVFPRHLQVAYGRGVFRLCHTLQTHGLSYLRDLPLNLADLAYMGFEHALASYRNECERTKQTPIV